MDALRAELARKRKERESERQDDTTSSAMAKKKYVSRGEIERARIEKERLEAKQRKANSNGRTQNTRDDKITDRNGIGSSVGVDTSEETSELDEKEVKRRLRLLKQPVTLFSETHQARYLRLKRVEKELVIEDNYAVGQQANVLLEIQKEEALERERMLKKEAALKEKSQERSQNASTSAALVEIDESKKLENAFKAAAARVAAEQKEKDMEVGDAIVSYIKRMLAEWNEELVGRPEEVKHASEGRESTLHYRTAAKSFEVLYARMAEGSIADDIKAALWLMVKAMKERNYLHASEIYVRLAIGNAPWPIGVTSVGIHDRSAREKISFAMNGQAHIMNDEATRKFIHAFKRLMTWAQKAYPTDPSRCLEFDTSMQDSLNAAKARGEALCLAPAPHLLGADGSVKAPSKWKNVLKHSGV